MHARGHACNAWRGCAWTLSWSAAGSALCSVQEGLHASPRMCRGARAGRERQGGGRGTRASVAVHATPTLCCHSASRAAPGGPEQPLAKRTLQHLQARTRRTSTARTAASTAASRPKRKSRSEMGPAAGIFRPARLRTRLFGPTSSTRVSDAVAPWAPGIPAPGEGASGAAPRCCGPALALVEASDARGPPPGSGEKEGAALLSSAGPGARPPPRRRSGNEGAPLLQLQEQAPGCEVDACISASGARGCPLSGVPCRPCGALQTPLARGTTGEKAGERACWCWCWSRARRVLVCAVAVWSQTLHPRIRGIREPQLWSGG